MLKSSFKTISTRLLASYSVPLVCLFAFGWVTHQNVKIVLALETRRDDLNSVIQTANDATYQLIDATRKIKGYLIRPGDTRYEAMYTSARQLFISDMKQLKESAMYEEDINFRQLVDDIQKEGAQVQRVSQQILENVQVQKFESATAMVAGIEAADIAQSRRQINEYLERQLEASTAQFEQAQQRLIGTILWGSAIAGLTTLSLGIWVTQQIRQQMRSMVSVVEQNGIQVTTSSTQIAASSRQLEASVTEQAASTTQIAATATEIAATAEELNQAMVRVMQLSESAAVAASSGQQDLNNIESTVHQLTDATQTISSKLSSIDNKANNIGSIVTAITKVADQTNLLSLNAAIEAEKAGEYGAGFSVVAREIRRLADQTAVATLEIEQMVKEMLSAVSTGVVEMDKFAQDVGTSARSIAQISEQMSQIIAQVQSLAPQFETVSAGVNAQAQGAQHIRLAMEQLNDSSQQTADSVKDTNQAIIQLGDVAKDLQSEVANFRVAV